MQENASSTDIWLRPVEDNEVLEENLEETLLWQSLRGRLLRSLAAEPPSETRTRLLAFMTEQWNLQAPRQQEVASLIQKIRRLRTHAAHLVKLLRIRETNR